MANDVQPEPPSLTNVLAGQGPGNKCHEGIKDEFELLWGLQKYLVLPGILAVSVTYNAGLTPPGGFWTLNTDGHYAGDPIMHVVYSSRYEVFFYCNATAFAASLVLIILLLSKSVTRQKIWLRSMQLTMIMDLFSLLGAYAAGSCRAPKSSIYIWVLVFAVFIYVGIHILVSIRVIPEIWTKKLQRMLDGVLTKWGACVRKESDHLEKDIEEARKFILMLVTFAATITYQAGLNPPGGFWAENEHGANKLHLALPTHEHQPATSVLHSNYPCRYKTFVSFNSTSFVASLVIIILLLSPQLSGHGIRTKAVIVCVVADLLCLVGAYAAGSCRDVVTSFYVVFIIIVVLVSFALLAGTFVYRPVANWLEKVKSNSLRCMHKLGRALSLNFGSNKPSNPEWENSHASSHQSSVCLTVAPAEDNTLTSEPKDQPADNEGESHEEPADIQQVLNIEDGESHEEPADKQHPPGYNQQSANPKNVMSNQEYQSTDYQLVAIMKEDVSSSQHPSGNNQQSEDILSNQEYGCKDSQLDANTEAAKSSTEQDYPSLSYQQTGNTKCGMSIENNHQTANTKCGMSIENNQQVASMREEPLTDEPKMTILPVEKNISVSPSNGDTSNYIVDDDVYSTEENILVEDDKCQTEVGGTEIYQEVPNPNDGNTETEKHLKKTRTCLLLLAILAVSLAYQSGLNPPGGFWSRSKGHHSAADRILEDNYHPRFIAFFYLNAVAFVASIVMIIMLLNKMMSKKATKRRALPITMIVVLLSLTGAFAIGNCRETKKTILISLLICVVPAYVLIHVLMAIHIIPKEWRSQVAEKLKQLSLSHIWSTGQDPTGDVTSVKELERRRNLLLILGILAVTVTYQAGMNPPGGVWSDNEHITGMPGNPILQDTHPKRYDVFYYSNSVSFVASVVVTILLVNKESCEHGIKSYALRVCLVVGLLGLLIAYVAGSCRYFKQSIYLSIIVVAVLVSLVIQVLLSSMHDTLGRPLAWLVGFLQSLLPHTEKVEQATAQEKPKASDCNEKIVRKRHKYLMLLAILAASITYQAGLNPPGGFWSDDKGHAAGNPVLGDINHQRYKIFFCFNSFAFMASIVVIMLLLSKSVRKKDVPLEVLHLIMILDLLAIMTSFAAGSCRKFRTSMYVYALVAGVVIYLMLVVVLSSGIAKYLTPRETGGLFLPEMS